MKSATKELEKEVVNAEADWDAVRLGIACADEVLFWGEAWTAYRFSRVSTAFFIIQTLQDSPLKIRFLDILAELITGHIDKGEEKKKGREKEIG